MAGILQGACPSITKIPGPAVWTTTGSIRKSNDESIPDEGEVGSRRRATDGDRHAKGIRSAGIGADQAYIIGAKC